MLWLFLASRETAFVYAITSSGVVHEVTKACSRGLLRECVCNNTQHQGRNGRGFQWGGCNDSIEHGLKYASEFIDSREKEQDVRAKINLHNNFVGRHVSTSSNTPFHGFFNFWLGPRENELGQVSENPSTRLERTTKNQQSCQVWKWFIENLRRYSSAKERNLTDIL